MTTSCPDVNTWILPRETGPEWVGPIVITKINAGTGAPVTDPERFAVLPLGTRPTMPSTSSDWSDPVNDPDGGSPPAVGVMAQPVSQPGVWGIWATVAGASEKIVLEPQQVGFIRRT